MLNVNLFFLIHIQMSKNQSAKQMRLFDFIGYHEETIPQELLYPGYRTDKDEDGQTPLMYWIE